MTVNYPSNDKTIKSVASVARSSIKARRLFKILLKSTEWGKGGNGPSVFIRLEKPSRGGQKSGRLLKVSDIYVDPEHRIYAGYSDIDPKDPGYQFTQYAAIGRLLVMEPSSQ